MTCAGRSRSRSLARPVSARTRRTSPGGNVLAITPRLMWSLTRMPVGRLAGTRAIVVARPRASASMAQLCPYVNRIAIRLDHVGALSRLSTEERDFEDSQQTIDLTGKDGGNCRRGRLPITHIFPRQINALPASPRSC